MKIRKKHITILSFFVAFFLFSTTHAQTAPELIISWDTNTSIPSFYHAKRLPTRNAVVRAHVELVDKNKVISLSNRKITWLVDNQLYVSKVGQKDFEFTVPQSSSDTKSLTAVILNYNSNDIRKTVEIPVVTPRVVIDAPFPFNIVKFPQITLKALTFFFSPEPLVYEWDVNGIAPSSGAENPSELTISLSQTTQNLDISLSVQNPNQFLETGSDSQQLQYIYE